MKNRNSSCCFLVLNSSGVNGSSGMRLSVRTFGGQAGQRSHAALIVSVADEDMAALAAVGGWLAGYRCEFPVPRALEQHAVLLEHLLIGVLSFNPSLPLKLSIFLLCPGCSSHWKIPDFRGAEKLRRISTDQVWWRIGE